MPSRFHHSKKRHVQSRKRSRPRRRSSFARNALASSNSNLILNRKAVEKAPTPLPSRSHHHHQKGPQTTTRLTQPIDDERLPEPKIIRFKVPWDILSTYLRPLVSDRSLRHEFSGVVQGSDDHYHENESGAEHVESENCSSEYVCMQRASIVHGSGDSAVFYEEVPYTYHTHPVFYYNEYGVKIAPPSGEDIGVFLRGCIEDKSCVHFVIAKEGIYYIIPNPCFVHQARRLRKRDPRKYNILMVGIEILGMQTHECRDSWTPERWLEWVRGRFVCGEILVHEYKDEIHLKFGHHCKSCDKILMDKFQEEFLDTINEFRLNMCQYTNPILNKQWGETNIFDVGFYRWQQLEAEQGLPVEYSVF